MIKVQRDTFGTIGNQAVDRFTLSNDSGVEAAIISYGAILQTLRVPDRNGASADIVLGFDSLRDYVEGNDCYFGAICGRVANRIKAGRFTLEGNDYTLATNFGPNALHGGNVGYDKRIWEAEPTADGVRLFLHSPDGEEGYPGSLDITVTYTLTDAGELHIDYVATADATTIINLTNHTYFNLAGHASGTVYNQMVCMNAPRVTLVDDTLMPTGEIADVAGTPLDFLAPQAIGEQLEAAGGYDHNYILDEQATLAARVVDPDSGRVMEMVTTEPAVQLYTGNFLEDKPGKCGAVYPQHGGFCLEAQHYPDSINQPSFPSTVLRPDETYTQRTTYRFSAE
jgi:aldose 1-epimerase